MSILDFKNIKTKVNGSLKKEEPEKILFGIGYNGQRIVPIYASGPCVEQEVYENLTDDWDCIMPDQPEDAGLWVWEGRVHYSVDYYGECDGPEFENGRWRAPTPEEWYSIMRNESPWETRLYENYPEEPHTENKSWI